MDRVLLLLRALQVQPLERLRQTQLLARLSPSWLLVEASLGALEVSLVSCYLGTRFVAGACISSRCPHCDTSRTVLSRLFQLLFAELVTSEWRMYPPMISTYSSFRLEIGQS